MEQYKYEGGADTPATPVKVSDESKQMRSLESTVNQLQETVGLQQQELMRLHREIGRLKNHIDDVVTVLRNRG